MKVVLLGFLYLFSSLAYAEIHRPQDFLKSIQGTKNEGEQIYQHFCINCHDRQPLIPLGAPRLAVDQDWKQRVQQGLNLLFKHTDEGYNAMPPRGGCFECTDQQLILTIFYMLPEQYRKPLIKEEKSIKSTDSKKNL
ncbi:c-type cytochrome [Legionella waltersii]|uniref:Cytochrome c5 n=1 Tax=Legionella waltersii TaxID=66969 RepID=A0A0W1ANV4_9GAMM|nr:c-type cytochrome [Legionella waltersii]KTD82899.1 cytochrome c5 [Legionella waltersii]SNV02193.1 cytochrome c5 [Legionella waltersii]